MSKDYIPAADALFDVWVNNFSTHLTATPSAYGVTAGDASAVAGVVANWNGTFAVAEDPLTRSHPNIVAKDDARAAAEAIVRPLAVTINRNSAVSPGNKAALGLHVIDDEPTPAPAPTTAPSLVLVSASHLMHKFSYHDPATPDSKAKPPGVNGLELWRSIGTAPATDMSTATLVDTLSKTPFVINYLTSDAHKMATYWARWKGSSDSAGHARVGPFCEAVIVATL